MSNLDPIDLPYVPVYIDYWPKITSGLPLDVQGALLKLVQHQWTHRSVPGDDPKELALIIGSGVATAQARRIWAAIEHLFTIRLVDGSYQIQKFEECRAAAEKKTRTDKNRAVKAARTRWDSMQRPRSNAPSIPLSTAPGNAPSIPPGNASQSQTQEDPSGNQQIGGVDLPQEEPPHMPSAPNGNGKNHGSTLIARGEGVTWFKQEQAKHRGCHPEVCRSRDSSVRVCMPGAMVGDLASKLPSMPQADAITFVIDWARQDVPPEGYVVPSSEFDHWRTRWDATIAKRSEAPATPSSVPSAAATAKRYLQ